MNRGFCGYANLARDRWRSCKRGKIRMGGCHRTEAGPRTYFVEHRERLQELREGADGGRRAGPARYIAGPQHRLVSRDERLACLHPPSASDEALVGSKAIIGQCEWSQPLHRSDRPTRTAERTPKWFQVRDGQRLRPSLGMIMPVNIASVLTATTRPGEDRALPGSAKEDYNLVLDNGFSGRHVERLLTISCSSNNQWGIVCHIDVERQLANDRQPPIGRLDDAWDGEARP